MRTLARLVALVKGLAIFASFVLLTSASMWPLPLHLRTHFLGSPTGDTGVYVWNLWIFRHELLSHGHLPFSTDHVFSYTGGADFALHNYAPVAGLVGTPLIGALGLVATFNVLMIAFVAASGHAMFVLGRRLGLDRLSAWAGGALFIACPILIARQTAHFSLIITAPLPLFLWALWRTLDTQRVRDAALVGFLCALASYCDAYFGIYCALMGAVVVGWRFTRLEWAGRTPIWRGCTHLLDGTIVLLAAFIAWRVWSATTDLMLAGIRIRMQTLYTPMLVLSSLAVLRAWIQWRPMLRIDDPERALRAHLRLGSFAVVVCLLLLTPLIVGIAVRFATDRLPGTETYWRSSPRGLDLLAYVVPNPNHAWFGDVTRYWLLPDRGDAFPEYIGSFSIVALIVVAAAAWRRKLPSLWVTFTAVFVLLSLGPFVYLGGVNTHIPGPWAFLRYAPVIGMARSPSRFAIVAALGMSLLFAFAVQEWIRTRPRWVSQGALRTGLLTTALAAELVSVPRPLYSAAVPQVYQLIATTDNESGRLLELPTGVRDGTSSLGDFNASTQYFQTRHRRRLIGGYLSRVSRWRRTENLRSPVLRALFALSERQEISAQLQSEASASRDSFLARSCVRYVVVNRQRATAALRTFAVDTLRLIPIHEDADYELLTPVDPPPCLTRSERRRRFARPIARSVGIPTPTTERH